jgi:hypothetical protein
MIYAAASKTWNVVRIGTELRASARGFFYRMFAVASKDSRRYGRWPDP